MSRRLTGTCTIALRDLVKHSGLSPLSVSESPAFVRRLTVNSHAPYDDELINLHMQSIVTTYE